MTASPVSTELRTVLPHAAVALARRSPRVGELILRAALRLEGGGFRSATAREILRTCHGVTIGAHSYGECFVPGSFPPGTTIGRYVSIADGVRALGRNHPLDRFAMHPYFFNSSFGMVAADTVPFGGLDVGADAWLGLRAILSPGCRRVGLGAVVAAGAVVTHDVPDFAVVAGVPARTVRTRFSDAVCDAIRTSRWWERAPADAIGVLEALRASLGTRVAGIPSLAARPESLVAACR